MHCGWALPGQVREGLGEPGVQPHSGLGATKREAGEDAVGLGDRLRARCGRGEKEEGERNKGGRNRQREESGGREGKVGRKEWRGKGQGKMLRGTNRRKEEGRYRRRNIKSSTRVARARGKKRDCERKK